MRHVELRRVVLGQAWSVTRPRPLHRPRRPGRPGAPGVLCPRATRDTGGPAGGGCAPPRRGSRRDLEDVAHGGQERRDVLRCREERVAGRGKVTVRVVDQGDGGRALPGHEVQDNLSADNVHYVKLGGPGLPEKWFSRSPQRCPPPFELSHAWDARFGVVRDDVRTGQQRRVVTGARLGRGGPGPARRCC
jgi:hypothetical protein